MFSRKCRKFLKINKGSKNPKVGIIKGEFPGETQSNREKPKKDVNSRGIQCFECSGYGHIKIECPNFLNANGRAFNA
jgi:hypothetical protein